MVNKISNPAVRDQIDTNEVLSNLYSLSRFINDATMIVIKLLVII